MKSFLMNQSVVFLGLMVSFGSVSVALADRGRDSGGGDSIGSKRIDVEFQASGAASSIYSLLGGLTYNGSLPALEDSRAEEMARTIRSKVDLAKVANGSAYEFVEGPCFDSESNGHMGGAVIGDASRPFCLSYSGLKKLPEDALFHQIAGLMAHELAHQAGYHERDAKYLQRKVIERLGRFWRHNQARISADEVLGAVSRIQYLLEHGGSAAKVCLEIGRLEIHVQKTLRETISSWDYPPEMKALIDRDGEALKKFQFGRHCDEAVFSPEFRGELEDVRDIAQELESLWRS